MQGKIVKGIAGFYYVHMPDSEVYECKAKGIFRKDKIKPLVGDDVVIDVLSQMEKTGNIREILPRTNQLIRPAVANIDQALVIFAAASPKPNFNLLDRFLVAMECQKIEAVICFNKCDLVKAKDIRFLEESYRGSGYEILFTSTKTREGLTKLREILLKKTTAVAGPSGVGKSSLINLLAPGIEMETGAISEKIERGKHTTRHSQLIYIEEGAYIMDTPGFSSLYTEDMEKEELQAYFKEFAPYEPQCRFLGCSHINEPDCGVKQALSEGKISPLRYENYGIMYEELKNKKRY